MRHRSGGRGPPICSRRPVHIPKRLRWGRPLKLRELSNHFTWVTIKTHAVWEHGGTSGLRLCGTGISRGSIERVCLTLPRTTDRPGRPLNRTSRKPILPRSADRSLHLRRGVGIRVLLHAPLGTPRSAFLGYWLRRLWVRCSPGRAWICRKRA